MQVIDMRRRCIQCTWWHRTGRCYLDRREHVRAHTAATLTGWAGFNFPLNTL